MPLRVFIKSEPFPVLPARPGRPPERARRPPVNRRPAQPHRFGPEVTGADRQGLTRQGWTTGAGGMVRALSIRQYRCSPDG
jgi:hypothetical protein